MKYDIEVIKSKEEGSIKAYANVTLGNAFEISGIKIIDGENGLFVSMPNYHKNKVAEGSSEYQDYCFPITKDFATELRTAIIDAYEGKNEPEITNVKVTALEERNDSLKGLATVIIDNSFAVTGIKIYKGENGLFVSMPSYKHNDEFRDVCHPVTASFREKLIASVINKYQEKVQEKSQEVNKDSPRQRPMQR